jgi:ABC-type arginine transport system ATPase subunit
MMGERVVIDGEYEKPWRAARERIGMIFRRYTLWPHMSVRENPSLAPRKVHRARVRSEGASVGSSVSPRHP